MEIIKLNLIPSGALPVVHASQYDDGRVFRADLFDGAEVYTLDGTEVLECDIKKPDGNVVTVALTNTSDSYVEITTTLQMCACSGESLGEINIKKDGDSIGTLNFILAVERSPMENGIESDTAIHNLEQQIADAVADQYDADSVIFDSVPTAGHGIGYAVTSEGVLNSIPEELDDLSDVTTTAPTSGEALVWDGSKWTNGTVSTVGSIDDLNDVDTTGKATGDSLRYDGNEWIAQPTTIEMTLAEWNAIADKQAWRNAHKRTKVVFTDAPNLNATSKQISYDGGTDTVWDKVESLKTSKANESSVAISKSTNFIGVDYSVTAYNITTSSTLSSAVQIRYKYDGNLLTISGRIVLDISSRTGSNGGVTIALKSGKKIKNSLDNYVGVSTYKTEPRNGEATILYADANATSFRLSASESYANLQSGKTLVLYVSPLSIELADI